MTAHSRSITRDDLFNSVGELRTFAAGMRVLAELAPERLTLSQALFFMLTAADDLAGNDPTYSEIKQAVGESINKSLNTTYRIFLKPSRLYANGLGWLAQEPSRMDNRVKFLRLTDKGREVLREVRSSLEC